MFWFFGSTPGKCTDEHLQRLEEKLQEKNDKYIQDLREVSEKVKQTTKEIEKDGQITRDIMESLFGSDKRGNHGTA